MVDLGKKRERKEILQNRATYELRVRWKLKTEEDGETRRSEEKARVSESVKREKKRDEG